MTVQRHNNMCTMFTKAIQNYVLLACDCFVQGRQPSVFSFISESVFMECMVVSTFHELLFVYARFISLFKL